jgi:hypothetical protein
MAANKKRVLKTKSKKKTRAPVGRLKVPVGREKKKGKKGRKHAGRKTKAGKAPLAPVKAGYLETDVDRLYQMVQKKGKVGIEEAAVKLKVKPTRVVAWGSILEEHKLSRMHYPPVGDPVLISNKLAKKEKDKAKKGKGAKGKTAAKGVGFGFKLKNSLRHPKLMFSKVKGEQGVGSAFKYVLVLSIIPAAALAVLAFVLISIILSTIIPIIVAFMPALNAPLSIAYSMGATVSAVFGVFVYVAMLVCVIVNTVILHIFARLLKAKGMFSQTFKAVAYGSTPVLLLGWIPLVGPFIGFWSLYLIIRGLSVTHEIKMVRALAIVLIPIIIVVAISLVVVFLGLTTFNVSAIPITIPLGF